MSELRMLRVEDVALKLSIAVSTVWLWARQGKIPGPRKVGATTVWSSEQIDEFIRSQFSEAA